LRHGFCSGNGRAAVLEYERRFPDRRIPSRHVFTRIHQTLRDTGSLPSVAVRIIAVAEQIRNHPDNIASAIHSLLIRAENCLANGGGHFEQLL